MWDASNVGTSDASGVLKNGSLEIGGYDFMDTDKPYTHGSVRELLSDGKSFGELLDSENGPYGSEGIFRLKNFIDSKGVLHKGVGIHSGRKNKRGYKAKTRGCIRTTDEAMKFIKERVKNDPLEKLEVKDYDGLFGLPYIPLSSPNYKPKSPLQGVPAPPQIPIPDMPIGPPLIA